MNMFLHEMKASGKSTFIWALSLGLLGAFMLSMFPTISDNAVEMKQILEAYPEAVRKALGISLESFTNLLGYYPFIFSYILLFGAIQAMHLGVSIVAKEERGKTADFLLAKPVSRQQIITFKLLAAVFSILITNGVYLGISSYVATIVTDDPFSMETFIMISLTLPFVQMVFLALGIMLSVLLPKIKSIISFSLGTVFAFYIISLLDSSLGEKKLRFLSPFEYFDLTYIAKNNAYETGYSLLALGVMIVSIAISYFVFAKKDIGS